MIEKTLTNDELEIELVSYIDTKQNIWFKGKDIAKILGYIDTADAVWKHVDDEYKNNFPRFSPGNRQNGGRPGTYINESGFYALVFASKLPAAKKIRDWVLSKVLPSARKYGQYKLFDNPNNNMFKIEN